MRSGRPGVAGRGSRSVVPGPVAKPAGLLSGPTTWSHDPGCAADADRGAGIPGPARAVQAAGV